MWGAYAHRACLLSSMYACCAGCCWWLHVGRHSTTHACSIVSTQLNLLACGVCVCALDRAYRTVCFSVLRLWLSFLCVCMCMCVCPSLCVCAFSASDPGGRSQAALCHNPLYVRTCVLPNHGAVVRLCEEKGSSAHAHRVHTAHVRILRTPINRSRFIRCLCISGQCLRSKRFTCSSNSHTAPHCPTLHQVSLM